MRLRSAPYSYVLQGVRHCHDACKETHASRQWLIRIACLPPASILMLRPSLTEASRDDLRPFEGLPSLNSLHLRLRSARRSVHAVRSSVRNSCLRQPRAPLKLRQPQASRRVLVCHAACIKKSRLHAKPSAPPVDFPPNPPRAGGSYKESPRKEGRRSLRPAPPINAFYRLRRAVMVPALCCASRHHACPVPCLAKHN